MSTPEHELDDLPEELRAEMREEVKIKIKALGADIAQKARDYEAANSSRQSKGGDR